MTRFLVFVGIFVGCPWLALAQESAPPRNPVDGSVVAKDVQFETEVKSAGAVLEKGTAQVIINADGTFKSKNDLEFRIQTEAGRTEFGLREVVYNPEISSVDDLTAFSQTGTELSRIPRKEMIESAVSNAKFGINSLKKIVIPFNNVKVGSSIVYRYTDNLKKPLIPNLSFFTVKFGDETPEQKSVMEVTSPKPLRTTVLDSDKVLEVTEGKVGASYTLTIKNKSVIYKIPQLRKLALVPSGVLPMVFISTAANWNEVAKPMAVKYEQAIESPLPPAFMKIVKEGSAQKDEIEKLKFVTTSVSKLIAYSGNWTSQSGMFFPRGHQQVVAEAKGDCKDFATSVAAILRKMGFEASVALVNSSNPAIRILKDVEPSTLVPSTDYFNHAVVFVKRTAGDNIWLDATNPVDYVEGIWPSFAGSPALILKTTTTELSKVPEKSSNVSVVTLNRTVSSESADQASWQGDLTAKGFSAIDLAHQRALHGPEKLDSALPKFLLGQSASANSRIHMLDTALKQGGSEIAMSFNTLGNNPIHEDRAKEAQLRLEIDESLIGVFRADESTGVYLGPASRFVTNTFYNNVFVNDAIDGDCFVLSDWIDFERTAILDAKGTTVKSTMSVKKSYVSASEAKTDDFKNFLYDLRSCIVSEKLAARIGAPEKVTENSKGKDAKVDFHKLPISSSSADVAEKEVRFSGTGLDYTYVAYKAKRIFEKQLEEAPKNTRARIMRTRAIFRLGYLSGNDYKKPYVDFALAEYDEILKANPKDELALYYKGRILTDQQQKHDDALAIASAVYKSNAASFLNRSLMAKVYLNKKDLKLATAWLESAKAVAQGDGDTALYLNIKERLAFAQHDKKERLAILSEIAKLEPGSPWAWHNLANGYYGDDNADKAIECEKKALAISDFGAARSTLALALNLKAHELMDGKSHQEFGTNRKLEEILLEAQKIDPKNIEVLRRLTILYLARTEAEHETDWLDKSDIYLAEGLKLDPQNKQFREIERKVHAIKAQIIAHFKQRNLKLSGRWPATFQ